MLRSLAALLVTVSVLGACSGSESNRDPVEETTGRPACSVPAAELRRPISADNPLFVFNIYGGPEEVFAVDTVLPDDVRPYFAIQYVPPEPYDHGEEFRARVESVLDAAEQLDFPLFIQTEHCYTRSETPPSYWSELFRRYTSLVGLVWAEISCTGLQLIGLDDDYIRRMKDTIETVAAHGAYFLWQDMGWDRPGPWESTPHVFVKAGSDEALYRTITGNAAHVILQDKHNGDGKRFIGPSAALGWWTSCGINHWGVNAEDWMWLEAGYRHLYAPSDGWRPFRSSWAPVFAYPDALFGMEWLIGMAGGATVFALEAPFHGFASLSIPQTTPAFENVLLPLIRRMLGESLIPSRDDVREKMKIAYHPTVAAPPELNWDDLFRGLYGPEISSLYEWLPSTGRYFFLPTLPVHSTTGTLDLFPVVFDDGDYAEELKDLEAKQALFDAWYPARGDGDSWFVNLGTRWFLANPNENLDVDTRFSFALNRFPGRTLQGNLPPHTFGIVVEESDRLRVHLSNYRIDSETDVWGNEDFVNQDPLGYVNNIYIPDPTDGALRRTTVRVRGQKAEPLLEIQGHEGFLHETVFDAVAGTYELSIDHNGPVDLVLELK